MAVRIIEGDCLTTLATLPDASVQCCVTSPPYYGLRDYGHAGQIGMEETPDAYVARLVEVFRQVRRVLRSDGTLWLNIGDSNGKDKQVLGIPWRAAFALQSDGWLLRSAIVWHKPNGMPEPVTDRPVSAHEMIFLFGRSVRYFYDAVAVLEDAETSLPVVDKSARSRRRFESTAAGRAGKDAYGSIGYAAPGKRHLRNVWCVPTQPYSGAHFATMPPDLAERCIKAGTKPGDTVLDPFGGAGTTGLVADRLKRNAILCELNLDYANLARNRIANDSPLFSEVS